MITNIKEYKNNNEILYRPSTYIVEKKETVYFIPFFSCKLKKCKFFNYEDIKKLLLENFVCLKYFTNSHQIHSNVKKVCDWYIFLINNYNFFIHICFENMNNFIKPEKFKFINSHKHINKIFQNWTKIQENVQQLYNNNFFEFPRKPKELIYNKQNSFILKNKKDFYIK